MRTCTIIDGDQVVLQRVDKENVRHLKLKGLIRPHPRRKGLWFVNHDATTNGIREELEYFHRQHSLNIGHKG